MIIKINSKLKSQLKQIGLIAQSNGVRAYLVGGPVRDLLCGKQLFDLDIAIEGNISDIEIELFTIDGQGVYKQSIADIYGHYNFAIDIKQFKAGIYFLRCVSDNRLEVKKVIVY